jgi:large subunit ribosomal protein L22
MAKRIREKTEKINAERDRRPQATAKYLRISPTKVRIVLDLIRGQSYFNALAILKSTPKAASELIIKVLESAGANAENNLNMSKEDLYVAECFANEGQTLKRYWYRSHGSADIILKRTSHITIILDEKKEKELVTKSTKKVEKAEKPQQKPKAQEGGK